MGASPPSRNRNQYIDAPDQDRRASSNMTRALAKQRLCLGLLSFSLFTLPALAGEPAAKPAAVKPAAAKPAVNPQVLGITESVLRYCAATDAADAAKLQEKVDQLVQGVPEEVVARIRKTQEYRTAYDSASDFVSKVADQNASKVCADTVAESK